MGLFFKGMINLYYKVELLSIDLNWLQNCYRLHWIVSWDSKSINRVVKESFQKHFKEAIFNKLRNVYSQPLEKVDPDFSFEKGLYGYWPIL